MCTPDCKHRARLASQVWASGVIATSQNHIAYVLDLKNEDPHPASITNKAKPSAQLLKQYTSVTNWLGQPSDIIPELARW